MSKVYFVLFAFISIISFHCQKEVSYVRQNNSRHPLLEGEATIQGNIVDETGQPAVGATVKSGDKTATTDVHGYFRIVSSFDSGGVSLVRAEKAEYFKAYRSFLATAIKEKIAIICRTFFPAATL